MNPYIVGAFIAIAIIAAIFGGIKDAKKDKEDKNNKK